MPESDVPEYLVDNGSIATMNEMIRIVLSLPFDTVRCLEAFE